MKSKTVVKTSVFPASEEEIFGRLQQFSTLSYIAFPYATFEPVNGKTDMIWRAGEFFEFKFRLFGFIPFGIHRIEVIRFDRETGIYTREGNRHVPVWNHRIILQPVDEHSVRYTDEVEIDAGWKTPFVRLWASAFYAHRQKKWIKLLRKS